jgi:L-gulono-1,4-lactone dehydrogenase
VTVAERREWRNWTGDQTCRPAAYVEPASVSDVAAAVVDAGERGRRVTVVGAGHSFSAAALTDGVLMSLRRLDRVEHVDAAAGLVRVQAGATLRSLNDELARHGCALENLGDIDVQSVGGATATATHGTGARHRNLSASVHAGELVTADGSVVEVSEPSDADAWRAARVHLGALGVVVRMTLRVVPAFTLRGVDASKPLDEVLEALDDLVDGHDHFEFFTFPHSPLALTRANDRIDDPARPRPRARAWTDDFLLNNYAFGAFCRFGRRFPSTIPACNRLVSRLAGGSVRIDDSHRIFPSPRLVRFTEMEYAIPRRHAADAVRTVRAIAERAEHRVSFPLEVRFVAADDAFLSPSYGRDTCYVAVHAFEGMEWESYFRAVEDAMTELDGRPHWGKRHFRTAAGLSGLYPQWDRFRAVRDRLDPGRRFTNDYVATVLGF